MRLRSDTRIHVIAAPMGCEVRRLHLPRRYCRAFRIVKLPSELAHSANLLLVYPSGITIDEP